MEVPTETIQNNPEEETTETIVERSDSVIEKEPEVDHSQNTNSEMQQILARVRQNFGKINVGPQFSEDDLVPVEMSDVEEDLENFSAEEEEQEQGQPGEDAEEELSQDSQEEPVANDTKAVIRALDEKITKYQKFLNKAKAKKFSAIR